ncbi:hypothetical protein [uncultured Sphingomonas sp.]|mgnify:CR=1 FL=1|uniref:hypothetical protein n=1 Tax=uncultured Sphingomonas sp. TaxID=158754 RepID=UPI0025FAF002|nr:hypothetical protein [uncultured Sphingomonas sp.]
MPGPKHFAPSASDGAPPDCEIRFAARLLDARKAFGEAFTPLLFCNPPLDILLDLFVAGSKGRPVLDACLSAGVPQSVALRWLTCLQGEGLVVEVDDPDRGRDRQTLIRLTERTRESVRDYLRHLIAGRDPSPGSARDAPPSAG